MTEKFRPLQKLFFDDRKSETCALKPRLGARPPTKRPA
jgi:hypothetical protein